MAKYGGGESQAKSSSAQRRGYTNQSVEDVQSGQLRVSGAGGRSGEEANGEAGLAGSWRALNAS